MVPAGSGIHLDTSTSGSNGLVIFDCNISTITAKVQASERYGRLA
jgi:hypothetical protein